MKFAPRNPVGSVLIATVWPAGQVTVPASRIDSEVALAQPVLDDRALGDGREHVDVALGQLGADRPVAVGGVAEHPPRPPRRGLGVDQVLGLRAVLLAGGRDVDRGDQRLAVLVAAAESL